MTYNIKQNQFTMKTLKSTLIIALLFFSQIMLAQVENYKETVVENPTAVEDITVVTNYMDAIISNKMAKAESLLATDYAANGPGYENSTKTEEINNWKQIHKTRTNQKNDYVYNSFRVLTGDLKGDWVSVWGTYSYVENGVEISLPYQFTASVDGGKIDRSIIYYDRTAIQQKMGYTITPPKK